MQETTDDTKQKIAAQMKLAETAFIKPLSKDGTFESGAYWWLFNTLYILINFCVNRQKYPDGFWAHYLSKTQVQVIPGNWVVTPFIFYKHKLTNLNIFNK